MDDSVQISCTRCKSTFRDRARRVQNGYSRQCPNCEVIIFFEEDSFDKNVRNAIKKAKKARRALREEQQEHGVTGAPSQPESNSRVQGTDRKIDFRRRARSGRSEETDS